MKAIGKIVKKFEETGVITIIEGPVHHRFARFAENIAIVSESVVELSYGTLRHILYLDLHLHPHKIDCSRNN